MFIGEARAILPGSSDPAGLAFPTFLSAARECLRQTCVSPKAKGAPSRLVGFDLVFGIIPQAIRSASGARIPADAKDVVQAILRALGVGTGKRSRSTAHIRNDQYDAGPGLPDNLIEKGNANGNQSCFDLGGTPRWASSPGPTYLWRGLSETAALIEHGKADWGVAQKQAASLSLDSIKILSPVTTPARIYCQGANYRQHMIESGMDPTRSSSTCSHQVRRLDRPARDRVVLPKQGVS